MMNTVQQLQVILADAGLYTGKIDGIWGPKSQAALDAVTHPKKQDSELTGDGTWPWIKAHIDGEDIVIDGASVTAFGGGNDSMDSGNTASGFSTKDNPSYFGCALPMRRDGNPQLRGSPIPKLPWKTEVQFIDPKTGRTVTTKLIDEGPAKWTKHGGDLSVAAARAFDVGATANNFMRVLNIRIVGGAKYA